MAAGDFTKELNRMKKKLGGYANAGDGVKTDKQIGDADPKTLSAEELKRRKKLNR